jgi:hypothetical protein
LLLDLLSNSLGRPPLAWCGEILCDRAQVSTHTLLPHGTWNVRSLHRSGSFITVTRELARYKLDLVGVQEVRWDKGSTVREGYYINFYGKEQENYQLGTGFSVDHRTISAVKIVEFVSDRI